MEQQSSQDLNNQTNLTNPAGPTLVDMQRFQKKKSRNSKKVLIILILVAIISAVVYYFFFFNKNNTESTIPENNSNVSETENNIDKNLDSDSDDLSDYVEKVIGTNHNNSDTDGDTYSDFEEIKKGYDPLTDKKFTEEEWYNIKEKIKREDEGLYEEEFDSIIIKEPITIDDVKSIVNKIDWQFSISREEDNEKISFLYKAPYSFKEYNEEYTQDTVVIWIPSFNFSLDNGETWQIGDVTKVSFNIITFIDNKNKNRCDINIRNGQEFMTLVLSGTGAGQYYKTINGRKIFKSGLDQPEGYFYMWCNKQNTLQIIIYNNDINLSEMIVNKYFETFGN